MASAPADENSMEGKTVSRVIHPVADAAHQ
jgi:hypothetical protein